MNSLLFSLLGLSILGVLIDVVSNKATYGVDFVYDIIVLVVIMSNIVNIIRNIF